MRVSGHDLRLLLAGKGTYDKRRALLVRVLNTSAIAIEQAWSELEEIEDRAAREG